MRDTMISTRSLSLLVTGGMLGITGCVVQDAEKDAAQTGPDTVVVVPMAAPATDTVTLTDTVTNTVTDTVNTVTPVLVPIPVDPKAGQRRGGRSDTGAVRRDTTR
jgi:hypothetical protein